MDAIQIEAAAALAAVIIQAMLFAYSYGALNTAVRTNADDISTLTKDVRRIERYRLTLEQENDQ